MPEGSTLTGDIRHHPRFASNLLGNKRDVWVYLPPGYRRSRMRYPVLYLHDGQNCFDRTTAFGGVEWGVDEAAERLIAAGEMAPTIIVAVANAGEGRLHEYAPTAGAFDSRKPHLRSKGLARKYGRFLMQELKPFIDSHYRTRPEAENTGLLGSSMGGLVTLSLGLWYPKFFRRLGVVSPSIWWDDGVLYRMVDKLKHKTPLRIWLDMGTEEMGWGRVRILRDCLTEKGWRLGDDLHYLEIPGGTHTEAAWAARVDKILKWLFPK
ncbi:MAG: alpha/beta hydrolase [Verrucomicrobia bacterium]|nr:alpha/beta hydrolase [Verrucomicrobiota bacterium]